MIIQSEKQGQLAEVPFAILRMFYVPGLSVIAYGISLGVGGQPVQPGRYAPLPAQVVFSAQGEVVGYFVHRYLARFAIYGALVVVELVAYAGGQLQLVVRAQVEDSELGSQRFWSGMGSLL